MTDAAGRVESPVTRKPHRERRNRVSGGVSAAKSVVGNYIIEEEIGQGSFATVYRARHQTTNALVAIKSVSLNLLSAKLLSNLDSEIAILRTLQHPHIVSLKDCIKTSHHIHLIMEYCSSGDLSNYIKTSQAAGYPASGLDPTLVRGLLAQLASSLRFLRERNLIHRDVKPQNLLLHPSSDPNLPILKLADFGFARSLPSTSLAETLCGSPLYMAPEILRYEKYDAKADLWSVGTVLFEMCCGKPPFRASNHVELLRRIEKCGDNVIFPDSISADIKSLLSGLLRKNPADRIGFDKFFAMVSEIAGTPHSSFLQQSSEESLASEHIKDSTVRRRLPIANSIQRFPSHQTPSPTPSIIVQRKPSDADEYIIVEKRTVEINALADDLKQSPHRPGPIRRLSINRNPSFGPFPSSPRSASALARALGMASMRLFGETTDNRTPSSPTSISLDSSIVGLLETTIKRANAVDEFAMVKFAQLPFADEEMEKEATQAVAAEAMTLFLKSLATLARGLEAVTKWWDGKTASGRLSESVQLARAKFNDILAKAEYVREFLAAEGYDKDFSSSVVQAGMCFPTAERLLYERAVEIARAAAVKELVREDLASCYADYTVARYLLESVSEECEGEDLKIINGWIVSVNGRMKQLSQLLGQS